MRAREAFGVETGEGQECGAGGVTLFAQIGGFEARLACDNPQDRRQVGAEHGRAPSPCEGARWRVTGRPAAGFKKISLDDTRLKLACGDREGMENFADRPFGALATCAVALQDGVGRTAPLIERGLAVGLQVVLPEVVQRPPGENSYDPLCSLQSPRSDNVR